LGWKAGIHIFLAIYGRYANSYRQGENNVFEVRTEICQKYTKIEEILFPCVLWIPVNTRIV